MSHIVPFDEFSEIWEQEPIVIPDTNAILDLYRYSSATSQYVLDILIRISDHVWITNQVNAEYLKHYRGVIEREKIKYHDVTNQVHLITQKAKNDIINRFHRYRGFDFPKIKELTDIIETKLAEIEAEATRFQDVIKDEIEQNKLVLDNGNVKLFMDQLAAQEKVGQPFSYREKMALFAEGDSRFLRKLPPGYMDEKEKDKKDETKTQKFGDLFVWKQLLLHAEECRRPVVFITNDNKPDWWKLNQDGRPESPRPELIEEFSCYSDQSFAMVGMGEFVDHIAQIFDIQNSLAYLELNAEKLVEDLMSSAGWQETMDENMKFTSYLIHSGDLQFAVGNPLTDVEVIEFSQGVLDIERVEYDGTTASLAGTFSIGAEVTIKQYGDLPVEGEVTVSGLINVQFELDAENKEDKIKQDTVKLQLGGFDVTEFVEYADAEDSEWASKDLEYCAGCDQYKDRGQFRSALCIECDN